jgi:hypothetical protein
MATDIQETVNGSDYPLQIHLEHLIRAGSSNHKWRVVTKEHRWLNPTTKEEGYIDLILTHRHLFLTLIVECKRINGNWTFLLPEEKAQQTDRTKVLNADLETQSLLWADGFLEPASYISSYCVLNIQGKKDSRTLEKMSGESLLSLEQLAMEETNFYKNNKVNLTPRNNKNVYLPVIVTTASLNAIIFDPKDVDIKSGGINTSKVEPIKFVRFQKNLATDIKYIKPDITTLDKANRENDRTVIVVNSEHFIDFLGAVDN